MMNQLYEYIIKQIKNDLIAEIKSHPNDIKYFICLQNNQFDEIRQYIRSCINEIFIANKSIKQNIVDYIRESDLNIKRKNQFVRELINSDDAFYEQLYISVIKPVIDNMKKQLKFKDLSSDNCIRINRAITKWIIQNLNALVKKLNIDRLEDGTWNVNWISPDYDLSDMAYIMEALRNYLVANEDKIISAIQLPADLRNELMENTQQYLYAFPVNNINILRKIRNIYLQENKKNKIDIRAKDLLTLNDKINDKIRIDYDISDDLIREKPIIVVQDDQHKNYVIFGHLGDSHGRCVKSKVEPFCVKNNISVAKVGYGYLLGDIAFIDYMPLHKLNDDYPYLSDNELIDILKNDSRIQKVYQNSAYSMKNGGMIKRLAKLIR